MIIMDKDRLYEYTTGAFFAAISNEVRVIGERAFAHGRMPVEFVVIPPSVTEIEDYAFFDCNEMSSILIPGSVTKIGKKAFGYGIDGKIPGFAIYGEAGSAAERYAADNGFCFLLQHENAPSFDDFTLGYYQTDRAALDLFAETGLDDDFTVPDFHEEAAHFIRKALEVYPTNYGEAVKYLEKAWWIYRDMHLTEAQIAGLEPEPSLPAEQEAALRRLAFIWITIWFRHSAAAALNGEWQEVYDCSVKVRDYIRFWIERGSHLHRMMCRTLGVTSLMLGNPAEALYWYSEEVDMISDRLRKNKETVTYRVLAECFERMSEALLLYGYLPAAENCCRFSVECRSAQIRQANKEADLQKAADMKNNGFRFREYDEFRRALLHDHVFYMLDARNTLIYHRDRTPGLSEKEKEEMTADIRRMEEIAAEKFDRQMKHRRK